MAVAILKGEHMLLIYCGQYDQMRELPFSTCRKPQAVLLYLRQQLTVVEIQHYIHDKKPPYAKENSNKIK